MKLARLALSLLLVLAVVATAALAAYAQGYRFREGSLGARYAPEHMPDARFVVCRIAYRSVRVEPIGCAGGRTGPHKGAFRQPRARNLR